MTFQDFFPVHIPTFHPLFSFLEFIDYCDIFENFLTFQVKKKIKNCYKKLKKRGWNCLKIEFKKIIVAANFAFLRKSGKNADLLHTRRPRQTLRNSYVTIYGPNKAGVEPYHEGYLLNTHQFTIFETTFRLSRHKKKLTFSRNNKKKNFPHPILRFPKFPNFFRKYFQGSKQKK